MQWLLLHLQLETASLMYGSLAPAAVRRMEKSEVAWYEFNMEITLPTKWWILQAATTQPQKREPERRISSVSLDQQGL